MSDDLKVTAELRESFGKGAARKLRALGKIPAVLYGHGTEPVHVSLPGHQMLLILRKSNAVLELDIDGKGQLALVKDVQKDPVRQIIEHLDLIVVKKGEKVQVDIPVHVEGESAAGTILNQDATTVSLEVEATHIPERVTVSVEGLEEGAQILAGDLELPKGASLITEADVLIVAIAVPAAPVDEETEAAEAAAEETAAEAEAAE
ncbi:50S ribosomal protein L25/general stress protein Ctc [Plantibacter sp. MCCC 1A11337]|uniref:50S ribosomal protein L25/general stress protein Ctc n=1 Tax=Plantibacter TaxID=190323 RepID=UPI0007D9DC70|nr:MULTISPECIES: 50S ribosomal protein L25/general stress protein Ctc [Plantibacter]AQX79764.1 50S ribosomal protein L25/general stress protein Ctc [Plantibacter flavus]NUJ87194.1 50S ribosomal protein L25/general stress protein Ctc [Plantibacter sp. MCCC 1A11337]OAN27898.1 50S ribosomal protein L25/general stress protein Ctc [Plantibacter sp. H53]OII41153.1 50S ribosomal protein L25/general stress protein Ctc [Plantibacter sp. MMLR14_011]